MLEFLEYFSIFLSSLLLLLSAWLIDSILLVEEHREIKKSPSPLSAEDEASWTQSLIFFP